MDVSHYQLEMPGLIVHAEDDTLVPASEAREIHEAWFDSRLLLLPEGGHQRVLADPQFIGGVMALLARSGHEARQSA
ncbi:putative aminoacrylate hydrolase RutD [compost metagenome]